ncbi:hypothetical protein [Marinimicrobium alkaliphilum]|uniref:hypothetical protein n=1 Tax=Marinimicrobium alkaliphilum TaxID=2202654 RepID=UPI000DB92C3F|nr:hypothetical protein [Marinimicrobium alkaliphilum]
MKHFYPRCGIGGLLLLCLNSMVWADVSHDFEPSARFRLGYVDPETGPHGRAASVLLRGHLSSQWHAQWHTEVALDHIARGWSGYHNAGTDSTERPVIPDPRATPFSRLLIGYRPAGANHALVHLGRQTLDYDNQRLIGSDDFWQNERTVDALSVRVPLGSGSRMDYAYVFRTRGIDNQPVENSYPPNSYASDYRLALSSHRHDSHLARLEWNEWDYMQLVGYGYRQDNRDSPQLSNDTLGARYRFTYRGPRLRYRAELDSAQQTLTGRPGRPRPSYRALDFTAGVGRLDIGVRHEHLGSDEGNRFLTPLGSNYRFQGLTGQAMATEAGLRDNSLALSWRHHPWRMDLRHHWFTDTTDGQRLGQEVNLDLQFRMTRRHQINIRYGRFSGANESADEQRFYVDYSFNR